MPPCPIPGRWVLDEIAAEIALEAAEAEVEAARKACDELPARPAWSASAVALDRYVLAVSERDALRAGRP